MRAIPSYKLFAGYLLFTAVVNSKIIIHDPANVTIETDIDDAEAAFGPPLPDGGLTGYIVKADPEQACTPIAPPPNISVFDGWAQTFIAVVRRSRRDGDSSATSTNCTFDLKVLNAQRAGYNAVIVYNWDSDRIFEMSGGPSSVFVTIPSVFIGSSKGNLLINQYSYLTNYSVTILPTPGGFDPFMYFMPFLIVAGSSFFILLIFVIIRTCRDRRKAQRNRLTRADLKAFPIRKYRKSDPEMARFDCCAICLEDYIDNDRLRILPCLHGYHARCVDEWLLTKKRVCPVCKQPIRTRREIRDEARRNARSVNAQSAAPSSNSTLLTADRLASQADEELITNHDLTNQDDNDADENTPLLNAAVDNDDMFASAAADLSSTYSNAIAVDDDDKMLDSGAGVAQGNGVEVGIHLSPQRRRRSEADVSFSVVDCGRNDQQRSNVPIETDQVNIHVVGTAAADSGLDAIDATNSEKIV